MTSRRILSFWLLFLLDLVHASALAFASTMLFSNVLAFELPWKKVLLITLPVMFFVLLLLRSKIMRRILLLLVTVLVSSVVLLAAGCLISRKFSVMCRLLLTELGEKVSEFDLAVAAPLLVLLGAVLLSALIVTFGRRTLCWAVLLPPIVLAVLSLFGARYPMWQLVMYSAFAVALILRRKFDVFLGLLAKARSKPLKGAPNPLLRGACLVAAAALITAFVRPKPIEGPLLGSKFSESISSGFENFVLSHPKLNDFFVNVLGIEIESRSSGKSATGWFNSKLGGPREDSDEPMLEVLSAMPKEYLRGFTYTDYRGDRWIIDDFPETNSEITAITVNSPVPPELTFRTAYFAHQAMPRLWDPTVSSVYANIYTEMVQNHIIVEYVNGYDPRSGVYIPEGTVYLSLNGKGNIDYSYNQNRLRLSRGLQAALASNRRAPDWNSYEATYYRVTADLIERYRLYERCVPGYYANLFSGVSFAGDIPAISRERIKEFSNYFGTLQDLYRELPASLPQRVYALADVLTRDYHDDWHKAQAIRNYLCSGQYRYTLTPGNLPAGRDFVDYFLFDSQEGYCTYFASAMTVLARAAGIPARYVEGFLLTDNDPADRNVPGVDVSSNGRRVLTGANQHAWCEIYMEGLGFVTIEATVGYGGSALRPTTEPSASPSAPVTPLVTPEPSVTPEPTATPEPTLRPGESPSPTRPPRVSPTPGPGASPTPDAQSHVRPVNKMLPVIILILIILVLSGILIYAILRAILRASDRIPGTGAKEPGAQSVAIYRRSAKLLGELTRVRRGTETPDEYLAALKPYLTKLNRRDKLPVLTETMLDPFAALSELYKLAEYGDNVDGTSPRSLRADAGADASARTEWQKLTSALRARLGRFRARLLLIKTMGKE